MKIFLSYASEHRDVAETIAFSLRDRGFEVFFDRDDLPAGRSYDEQIEMAVGAADLLVFLISPESVDPGRFTLTEIAFARRRWRTADGHVLPVLVAETDLGAVPPFLKSVNILQPAGNVAAEVSSAVAAMARPPSAARIVPTAIVMGIATGLLTTFVPLPLDTVPDDPIAAGYILHYPDEAPLGAPVFFGVGLTAMIAAFERPAMGRLLLVLAGVLIGWLLAINLYLNIGDVGDIADDSDGVEKLTTIALVGIGAASGAAGALCTGLGTALAVRRLMHIDVLVWIVMTGLAFGTLMVVSHSGDGAELQHAILFCCWQAAVAGTIAWSLSRLSR